jgi:hypothetical protein
VHQAYKKLPRRPFLPLFAWTDRNSEVRFGLIGRKGNKVEDAIAWERIDSGFVTNEAPRFKDECNIRLFCFTRAAPHLLELKKGFSDAEAFFIP